MLGNDWPRPDAGTWRDAAACLGMDPAIFIPAKEGHAIKDTARAKATCARCPVKAECLETNIAEPLGVWGGLTESERRNLRRRRRRAARKASA